MPNMPPINAVKQLCDILAFPFSDDPHFEEYFATALRLPASPPQMTNGGQCISDGNTELAHAGNAAMNLVVSMYGLEMGYPTRLNDDNRRNKLRKIKLAAAYDEKPSLLSLVCRNPAQPSGDISRDQKAAMVQAIAGAAYRFGDRPLTEQIMRSFDVFPS